MDAAVHQMLEPFLGDHSAGMWAARFAGVLRAESGYREISVGILKALTITKTLERFILETKVGWSLFEKGDLDGFLCGYDRNQIQEILDHLNRADGGESQSIKIVLPGTRVVEMRTVRLLGNWITKQNKMQEQRVQDRHRWHQQQQAAGSGDEGKDPPPNKKRRKHY